MEAGGLSRSALAVAAARAAHQVLDGGCVLADPLAGRILGEDASGVLANLMGEDATALRGVRLYLVVRSRIAEDALAGAVAGGIRQAVVLGAGLDTLGCRNPFAAAGLRIFEVDRPGTQDWKRQRLGAAGIPIPPSLTFVPADLERQRLADVLAGAGLDASAPVFFTWLGVIPYLTREAITSVLGYIASLPAGTQAVADYLLPARAMPAAEGAASQRRRNLVCAADEPMISLFLPGELATMAGQAGLAVTEDLDPREVAHRLAGQSGTAPVGRVARLARR